MDSYFEKPCTANSLLLYIKFYGQPGLILCFDFTQFQITGIVFSGVGRNCYRKQIIRSCGHQEDWDQM